MSKEDKWFQKKNIDIEQLDKIKSVELQYKYNLQHTAAHSTTIGTTQTRSDNLVSDISSEGSTITSHSSSIGSLESNLTMLMASKKIDMYEPIFYYKEFIDIDGSSPTLVDFTGYLEEQSGDSYNFTVSDSNLLETNKTYYVELTGEFVADSNIRTIDFDGDNPIFQIKQFTRTEINNQQSEGGTFSSAPSLSDNIQLVYGGTTLSTSPSTLKYTHARTTTIQGSSRQTNGALIKYTGIFNTASTWRTNLNNTTTTQKGYGLYIPGLSNFEVRNLYVVFFELVDYNNE